MLIQVLDTETTGTDPEKDRIVELASTIVGTKKKGGNPGILYRYSTFVNPERNIPPEARGIHHISDADVAGAPLLPEALETVEKYKTDAFAAHFAEFDSKFLPTIKGPWICTYRCARHIWPDAPGYSNQTLRYWLELFPDEPSKACMPPHRAGPDTWVTAHILLRMLQNYVVKQLVEMTAAPILLKTITFGKHRGLLWKDAPRDYLQWIARQPDFDRDTVHTVAHYLRGGK